MYIHLIKITCMNWYIIWQCTSWYEGKYNLGPVSLTVFPSQFKFDGNFFHSHHDYITVIATNFCTWHDSCAVVACAKHCCDLMAINGITARQSFHGIWIAGKRSLVERAPGWKMTWMSRLGIFYFEWPGFISRTKIFCLVVVSYKVDIRIYWYHWDLGQSKSLHSNSFLISVV